MIGVPIALAALVLAYLALPDDGEPRSEPETTPELERVDLIVRNDPLPERPALELLVHNGGRGRSVVSRAELEIARIVPLPLCFTQGGLGVSESYGAELPVDAEPGTVVTVPVHQQVAPDAADRFEVALSVVGDDPVTGEGLRGVYLFELDVSLAHDGKAEPLPMGRALVSLPTLPLGTEYVLAEGDFQKITEVFRTPSVPLREAWAEPMACWRENTKVLMGVRVSEAARSPQLDEIFRSASLPSFSEVEP